MSLRRINFHRLIWLIALLMALQPREQIRAAEPVAEEYAVKAALVYNFARFTEWPAESFADPDDALRVVVIGNQDLVPTFSTIDGKQAAGRRIEVVFANRVEDLAGCHILFLARDKEDQWPMIHETLADDPVLIIGEINGFLESGGTMNLHLDRSKIRFQVNLIDAQNRGLHISSRILKLATLVIDKQREKD